MGFSNNIFIQGTKGEKGDPGVVAGVGISHNGIKEKLSGLKGSPVKVRIKSSDNYKTRDVVITRDKIPIYKIYV